MKKMWSKNELKNINQVETRKLLQSGEEVINGVWEEDIDLTIRDEWLNGLTLRRSYCKLLIKNGVMYIVLSMELKNETESSITTPNNEPLFSLANIKDSIAEKIYRKDGTNLLVPNSSSSNILAKTAYVSTTTGGDITPFGATLNSDSAKSFYLYPRAQVSINANAIKLFDYRVYITL